MAIITVILVIPLSYNVQAQRRGKGAQRRRNPPAATNGGYKIGEPINVTGTCEGTINFPEKGLSGPATIKLEGKTFTITPNSGEPLHGDLSVRAMSSHLLAMAVNLTFDPRTPLLSVSLRGCYNISPETCENPGLGQVGKIEPGLTLRRIPGGEPREFSFENSSCSTPLEAKNAQ